MLALAYNNPAARNEPATMPLAATRASAPDSALNPVPAMIERSEGWYQVCFDLDAYFARVVKTYEARAVCERATADAVADADQVSSTFAAAGCDGVRDAFLTLKSVHVAAAAALDAAAAAVTSEIRPKLAELISDLERSIGDFKSWTSAFRDPLHPTAGAATVDPTLKERIELYESAVAACVERKTPAVDPFVLKASIDRRIAKIVHKMNKQADSFAYAQDAAKTIDATVSDRIQGVLAHYGEIEGRLCQTAAQRVSSIVGGFVNQPKLFEYRHWLESQLAPHAFTGEHAEHYVRKRSGEEFGYPEENSIYAVPALQGSLDRRTRVLHSYTGGDYVLTLQSLIEIARHRPVWAIDLLDAELVDDAKAQTHDQFVLRARQHGSRTGKLHKFVFKTEQAEQWRRAIAQIIAGQVPDSVRRFHQAALAADRAHAQEHQTTVDMMQERHAQQQQLQQQQAATAGTVGAVTAASAAALASTTARAPSIGSTESIKSSTLSSAPTYHASVASLVGSLSVQQPPARLADSPTAQAAVTTAAAIADADHFARFYAPAATAAPITAAASETAQVEETAAHTRASTLDPAAAVLSGAVDNDAASVISDLSDVEREDSGSSDDESSGASLDPSTASSIAPSTASAEMSDSLLYKSKRDLELFHS